MKTVTYKGPKDEGESSDYLVVGDVTLYVDKPTDVEDDQVAAIVKACDDLDHVVEIGEPTVEPSEAEKLANANTAAELEKLATDAGVATSGTKAEVAQRILDHQAAAGGTTA